MCVFMCVLYVYVCMLCICMYAGYVYMCVCMCTCVCCVCLYACVRVPTCVRAVPAEVRKGGGPPALQLQEVVSCQSLVLGPGQELFVRVFHTEPSLQLWKHI